jgi:alcohol dehydrogenase class IV
MQHDLNRATPQQFLTPHEVRCGDGAVVGLGQMLQGWQVTTGTVLLVCDKVLHKLGHVTQVQEALADASFNVDVFDDVEGEPDSATARTLGGWCSTGVLSPMMIRSVPVSGSQRRL